MIQFLVAGVIYFCHVLWMIYISVVSLGGWMKWDAVLTEIVVVCRGMSSLCVWWITMVMSHKQKKQRSLESVLKCEFYWINKLYIYSAVIVPALWQIFWDPEMSHLSLWQLSRAKTKALSPCQSCYMKVVFWSKLGNIAFSNF